MRKQLGLAQLLLCWWLTACSGKLSQGPSGGSDVVQPLWNIHKTSSLSGDTLQCARVVALLIGISQYDPVNGWEKLNAQNDVDLMVATLRKQGVPLSHIHTLTDRQATKGAIERALKTLADTLAKGSQLIVLYAGHARQLADINGDEADGYDEAIVPYDAPPVSQLLPEGYLRDDDLDHYLTKIRETLGPAGSLWLLFDSCHSQTLNRGQTAQRLRGGVEPLGRSASTYSKKRVNSSSDWYEPDVSSSGQSPYVLFSATTDNGPSFETTDASGRSFGPLTRAVCEAWNDQVAGETYKGLFRRVAVVMARYAPYQQPGLAGNTDQPLPGCQLSVAANSYDYRIVGEPLRVAWSQQDAVLTKRLANLPFIQLAGAHPDLRIESRGRGYRLKMAANNQPVSSEDLSTDECVERIRQYFARNALLQLWQMNPNFQVNATMQRVSVKIEQGHTLVTDTLPALAKTGMPMFRASANERVLLSLTNTGSKAAYLTLVDCQPDGTLHVLLPETGHAAIDYHLKPGQSLNRRIRMTKPYGLEVYKILLTPQPISLPTVVQMRGNYPATHPYETLLRQTYSTRGMTVPVALSDDTGAVSDIAFWVSNQ